MGWGEHSPFHQELPKIDWTKFLKEQFQSSEAGQERSIGLAELEEWYNELNDLVHRLDDDGSGLLDIATEVRDSIYRYLK